jgi:lipopolysaccharide export system protein LptA
MSKQFSRNSLSVVVSLLLLAATSVEGRPGKNAREPLVITSNSMDAEKLGDRVTFTGQVTLKKESMTLTSDVMVVYYDPGSKDIRKVEAHGNVTVRKEGRLAFSNDALYSSREETIVLTGNASIIENENRLGGEKITLFMADDRSIVEGGGKVMFYKDKALENGKRK